MLLLDKFFSSIKNAIESASDILEISGASPPVAALDTIEGTNKYIYDELQLVANSVLYPCRVEYHTAYDFRHLDTGTDSGYPFFVEKADGLELLFLRLGEAKTYNFSTGVISTYDSTILQGLPYTNNFQWLRDVQYKVDDSIYEFSVYARRATPPYDRYYALWNYDTSFNAVGYTNIDTLYYRGFNTNHPFNVEMFRWQPYFNLQFYGDGYMLSLGRHIYVFDSNWSLTRRIFLNNSFLIGEERDNCVDFSESSGPVNSWGKVKGLRSYFYSGNIYVSDTFGSVEIYKID